MRVQLNTSIMHLEDIPIDIGYASEKVTLTDVNGTECTIGGHNGNTQLIITTPFIDDDFINEMHHIDEIIPTDGENKIEAFLVVANDSHNTVEIPKFDFLIDSKEELRDFYGVRLTGKPYDNELTKAIILISKDGAIYYDQFCDDLTHHFNKDILYRKILAAQLCYTGKGCH